MTSLNKFDLIKFGAALKEFSLSLTDESFNVKMAKMYGICGINWNSGAMATTFADDEMSPIHVFQSNLMLFRQQVKVVEVITQDSLKFAPLLRRLRERFELRASWVLTQMAFNFLEQVKRKSVDLVAKEERLKECPSSSLKELLAGRREDAMKLVPSRSLARQLGISDQRLRREIYLARQRRPSQSKKRIKNGKGEDEDEGNENELPSHMDISMMEVVTCASPISAADHEDFDEQQHETNENWLDIATWLNSDLFEPNQSQTYHQTQKV